MRIAYPLMLAVLPFVASAQTGHSGAFVTTLGKDTISIERFTRTPRRLEGDILVTTPRAIHTRYVVEFDEQQNATLLTVKGWLPGAGGPPLLDRLNVVRDTLVLSRVFRQGRLDTLATADVPVPRGALPFISGSTAIYEEMVQRYLKAHADSMLVTLFVFGPVASGTPGFAVKRVSADTILISGSVQPQLVHVDGLGKVLSVDARLGTVRTFTRRVPDADIGAVEHSFAARGLVGALSARDTLTADVNGASLWIDYGQPRARGRKVFGGLVPYGQVWRTGANAATQFRTSVDLQFGSAVVPAGMYTLWTIPSANGTTLIVNKQTGQWGTQYDPAQDLVRIPMRVRKLTAAQEQFAVRVEPAEQGGSMIFGWENTEMIAPFRIRR